MGLFDTQEQIREKQLEDRKQVFMERFDVAGLTADEIEFLSRSCGSIEQKTEEKMGITTSLASYYELQYLQMLRDQNHLILQQLKKLNENLEKLFQTR